MMMVVMKKRGDLIWDQNKGTGVLRAVCLLLLRRSRFQQHLL
jgi:hypothetical protein